MRLFFFSPKNMGIVIIDEGKDANNPHYKSPESAFLARQCIAGTNGSFFTLENNPLGLVIQSGKRLHPLETGSALVSGVLADTGSDIFIMRSKSYLTWLKNNKNTVKEALQGGPFLIENGNTIKGLDNIKSAERTFIARNDAGQWCLGSTSSLTLHELACWLGNKKKMNGFSIKTALNLDGGSSSLFWTKQHGTKRSPLKPVRNYLGIAPRKQ